MLLRASNLDRGQVPKQASPDFSALNGSSAGPERGRPTAYEDTDLEALRVSGTFNLIRKGKRVVHISSANCRVLYDMGSMDRGIHDVCHDTLGQDNSEMNSVGIPQEQMSTDSVLFSVEKENQ
ncbi:hypothetical protein TESG_04410 [Trichophyton tonsurans CBS 112818]|uniref:Uncharacterized protein n=1 Tax=Trichophyton tonsurans (strain CBS 112818) TaxID=647933 RepID=F2S089_TRIT1|nr:hypothetical protein TESG_04410 [Trichophyton tonsurans CBS 112818]